MLLRQKTKGDYIAAICASPAKVLLPLGILEGEKATCYPSLSGKLKDQSKIHDKVVVSHKLSKKRFC